MTSGELLRQGVDAARAGRRLEAREILLRVVDLEPRNELAWMWLTGLVDDLEDKIIACENVLTINPANEKVKAYWGKLLQQRMAQVSPSSNKRNVTVEQAVASVPRQSTQKPGRSLNLLAQAEQLEYEGRFEEALQTYERLAARTKDSREFDHVYRKIVRLEGLQRERIRFVSPASSILRMTFTWPLLYASFAFVQMGLNPIAHFSFLLWLGLPCVALGGFMLAVSEVRSRHAIWQRLFLEDGSGSRFARSVLSVAGWIFVIVPFVLMILNSLARLQVFQIPPEPFLR
jgi:tetratricopeptide (TPR) repeat protein